MSDAFDPRELLEVFLAEAEEQLNAMDQALLALERAPSAREPLEALFRAAHTLKASAAAQGFEGMSVLSHWLEAKMDAVRSGDAPFTQTLADVLLAAADSLREMLAAGVDGEGPPVKPLIADFEAQLSAAPPEGDEAGTDAAGAAPPPASAASPADSATPAESSAARVQVLGEPSRPDAPVHRLMLVPSPDCLMPAARAWLWLQQIEKLGRVLMVSPPIDEMRAGELPTGNLFVLLEATASREELLAAAEALPEIASAEVTTPRHDDLKLLRGDEDSDAKDGGPSASAASSASTSATGAATVRVKVAHLDALMRLVGELVLYRARLMRQMTQLGERVAEVAELRGAADQLSAIVTELRDEVMKARLVPLEYTLARFPRLVRDVARKEGKEVELVIEGADTEVDRTVAELIVDPLKHLLRNAVSHGTEAPAARQAAGKPASSRILLKAQQVEGSILITVSDDGPGVDVAAVARSAVTKSLLTSEQAAALSPRDAMELLFTAGFSTAGQVTDISGRGVGLDVVRSDVEQIGGRVEVASEPGHGTTFSLYLPLTLAIMPALIVENHAQLYALPLSSVLRIVRVEAAATHRVDGCLTTNHLGRVLQLVDLGELVGEKSAPREMLNTLVVRVAEKQVGLVVERVIGEQEIVISPLPTFVGQSTAIGGLATVGEGEFVLLVDTACLASGPAAVGEPAAS